MLKGFSQEQIKMHIKVDYVQPLPLPVKSITIYPRPIDSDRTTCGKMVLCHFRCGCVAPSCTMYTTIGEAHVDFTAMTPANLRIFAEGLCQAADYLEFGTPPKID